MEPYQILLKKKQFFTTFNKKDLLSWGFSEDFYKDISKDSCQDHINIQEGYLGALILNYISRTNAVVQDAIKDVFIPAYKFAKVTNRNLEQIFELRDNNRPLVIVRGLGDNQDFYISIADLHFITNSYKKILENAKDPDAREKLVLEYQKTKNPKILDKIVKLSEKHVIKATWLADPHVDDPAYDFDDLVINGYIGLLYAIDTFDINKKMQFQNYAHSCITWWVRKTPYESGRFNFKDAIYLISIRKFREQYMKIHEKEPTDREYKNFLINKGEKESAVELFIEKMKFQNQRSLNQIIGEKGEELSILIRNKKSMDPLNQLLQKEEEEIMKKDVSEIPKKRDRKIMEEYLLNGWSLEIIGEMHNRTRERIRQIVNKYALDPKYLKRIKDLLGIKPVTQLEL